MPVGEQISVLPASPPLIGTELVPVVTIGVITAITQAASAVVSISNASVSNPFSVGQDVAFSGVGGMTQINSLHGIVSAIGGAAGAWTLTVPINSSAFSAYTSGGEATATVAAMSGALGLTVRSVAEISAGVVPTNFFYHPLDPLRYGAIGDGTTDDTAAMNTWAAVINAAGIPITSVWTAGKVYLCGPITTITANDLTLLMNGSTIKVKPNSWPSASVHLNLTGVRSKLYAGTLDGNQAAFSGSQTGFLLVISSDFLMVGMTLKNSALVGMQPSNISGGVAIGCHFDDNANIGVQASTCSYLKFIGCTFNRNGYGFHGAYNILGTGSGFGLALRFRCHHVTLENCEAQKNGLDGLNVNQGSYAIKFIGCTAWGNNDGGFTIAADNTSVGTPGNLESPYDLEYVDCESYDNWGSGIVANCPIYNITVMGGRHYNNGRGAGTIAPGSQVFNGIYLGGGSLGVNVKTKAYDDRQLCPITAVSGTSPRVLTATNWGLGNAGGSTFVATASQYPVVALYNATLVFQGFAFISAEASGSVSITAAGNNPVTLSSIAAGWFVSQRVQFNGCFADSGSQGQLAVDGFGFLPAQSLGTQFGWKTVGGFLSNGQNLLLPEAPLDYTELLVNPTWDSAITNWTFNVGAGGASNLFTTAGVALRSAGCLQLIGGTSAVSYGDSTLIGSALAYTSSCWIEASCWVFSTNAGDSSITLFYNTGGLQSTTVTHPGGGWKQLKIGIFCGLGALTNLFLRVLSAAGKTNYFDTASIRVKSDAYDNRDFSYPSRNLPQ